MLTGIKSGSSRCNKGTKSVFQRCQCDPVYACESVLEVEQAKARAQRPGPKEDFSPNKTKAGPSFFPGLGPMLNWTKVGPCSKVKNLLNSNIKRGAKNLDWHEMISILYPANEFF